jgi:hypothetical protein
MHVFGCDGPGAGEAIARNIGIAYMHAGVTFGLLSLSLALFRIGPRRWWAPGILLGLLALHPAWTISAIRGDCGETKRVVSWLFMVVGSLILFWQAAYTIWWRWYAANANRRSD